VFPDVRARSQTLKKNKKYSEKDQGYDARRDNYNRFQKHIRYLLFKNARTNPP